MRIDSFIHKCKDLWISHTDSLGKGRYGAEDGIQWIVIFDGLAMKMTSSAEGRRTTKLVSDLGKGPEMLAESLRSLLETGSFYSHVDGTLLRLHNVVSWNINSDLQMQYLPRRICRP